MKTRLRITSPGTSARAPGAALDDDERDEHDHAERDQSAMTRGSLQPQSLALVEREQQATRARPMSARRRRSRCWSPVWPVAGLDRRQRTSRRANAVDRQVEEEHPAPAQRVGQHAAEQRPDRVAEAGRADDQAAGQPRLVLGEDA